MKLTDQLQEFSEKAVKDIPADIMQKLQRAMQDLEQKHIADKAKKKGEKIDSFELPNASGGKVALDKMLESGPVVLSFYRGSWCPYCNMELRALQERLPEMQALGAQLLAVSPQVPDKSLSTVEKNALDFEVASDLGNRVARDLGLVFELAEDLKPVYKQWGADLEEFNGDDKYELPIPSTFVVNTDGTIIHAHHDIDHSKRMDPDEIIDVLKSRGSQ